MITITRRFEFDAAHRILGHEGKCRHLHGHRYAADVTVQAPELDDLGRIIDFGVLKKRIGEWIEANWDHNVLLNVDDPLTVAYHRGHVMLSHEREIRVKDIFGDKIPHFLMNNPTAEVIAGVLFQVAVNLLSDTGIKIVSVRIYETPNCYADFSQ